MFLEKGFEYHVAIGRKIIVTCTSRNIIQVNIGSHRALARYVFAVDFYDNRFAVIIL